MLDKEINKDLSEIKPPGVRLNIRMLLMAIVTMSSVIYTLWHTSQESSTREREEFKEQIINFKEQITDLKKTVVDQDARLWKEIDNNRILKHQNDSLLFKAISDKIESIKLLEKAVGTQNSQIQLYKKTE